MEREEQFSLTPGRSVVAGCRIFLNFTCVALFRVLFAYQLDKKSPYGPERYNI